MARQKLIESGEAVGLKLTAAERTLVVDCLYVTDDRRHERIRQAPKNQDVPLTLDELEDLHGDLSSDANHTDDRLRQRALDKILGKIERLLDLYREKPPVEQSARVPSPASSPAPMISGSTEVPAEFRQLYLELVSLTDEFCNERLNVEYQELCREVAILLCQDGSPADRGKRASWASGIVYAVGWVNFLGDPSREPHVRSEEIAEWFGVSTATMHSKARTIREGLDLIPLDPRLTLPSRMGQNPLVWMLSVNGLVMDIRDAPREAQQVAFDEGLIPYIPAGPKGADSGYAVSHQRVPATKKRQKSTPASTDVAYQIKITLDRFKPVIWRRLRVPDATLDALHEWIQTAMGWQNCHLHEFSAGKERFVMSVDEDFGEGAREESEVTLSELVAAGHKKLHYWYDFGDDWHHTIKIEKTLQPQPDDCYPACTAGAGACPPEDVGGVWGYAEFLDAIADPKHERHEELDEWYGEGFDPERFSVDEVNRQLAPRR